VYSRQLKQRSDECRKNFFDLIFSLNVGNSSNRRVCDENIGERKRCVCRIINDSALDDSIEHILSAEILHEKDKQNRDAQYNKSAFILCNQFHQILHLESAANGLALSCGVIKCQLHPTKRVHAEYFAVAIDRYPQCKLYPRSLRQLECLVRRHFNLRRTILIKQLIVFIFYHPTNERGGANKTLPYVLLTDTKLT